MGRAYLYSLWMTGSEAAAAQFRAKAGVTEAMAELEAIEKMHAVAVARSGLARAPQVVGSLRSQETAVVDLDHPAIRGDRRRLPILEAELRRACLTAALLEIPPGPRSAFVLVHILRFTHAEASEIWGGRGCGMRTALTRSITWLEGLLESRCEHLSPRPTLCACSRRLGHALQQGLVADVDEENATPVTWFSRVEYLYQSLRRPR